LASLIKGLPIRGIVSLATAEKWDLSSSVKSKEALGFFLPLILLYVFFEYGRPNDPFHLPLIISFLLTLGWLSHPVKKWNVQIVCFVLLLAVMFLDIPFAVNSFSAFWVTFTLATVLIATAIPLIHFVDSIRKFQILVNVFMLVLFYVGLYALFHSGFGPQGAAGAQDENYVASAMTMAMPFAFFSFLLEKSVLKRTVFAVAMAVYVSAVIVGLSRGGFLGMACVFGYCVIRSPHRWLAWIVGVVVLALVLFFAGQSYWDEMSTITDTSEGTADLRLEFWSIAWREFLDYPLTGVGPGNYRWQIGEHQTIEQTEKFHRDLNGSAVTHSLYFELLAELGIAGVILFMTILYQNYKDGTFIEKRCDSMKRMLGVASIEQLERAQLYGRAVTGSLIGCLVTSAFLSTLYFSYFWILTAMLVALRESVAEKSLASKVG
jgi:O-antigen ligase